MQEKIYPHAIQQAYLAEVLLRKIQSHSVGTRYPFKDQVVITSENTMRHGDNDIFTYSQRIDVVIRCENKIEALKVNQALRDYFAKEQMLPLTVGVFQRPYLKENQKARKYFSYSTIGAKELLSLLAKYTNDKSLKYALGASTISSNVISNGFDLTYSINKFNLEHTFLDESDAKTLGLNKPIYRLTLYTSSIIELDSDVSDEELINFEINGESESEVIALAKKLIELQNNGVLFTCKGQFPRPERDFYRVKLDKTASEILASFTQKEVKP